MNILRNIYMVAITCVLIFLTGCFAMSQDKYTVIWLNYDDTVLDSKSYEKNETPVYTKDIPTHPYSGYLFTGWDKTFEPVVQDITYKAVYTDNLYELSLDSETNTYTITGNHLNEYAFETIVLPQSFEGIPIDAIGIKAFENLHTVSHVVIPYGIKRIEASAFLGSRIKEIDLPDSLVYIGDYAFSNNYKLESFIMPDSVLEVGEHLLSAIYVSIEYSSLTEVKLSNNLKVLPKMMLSGTSIENLKIPSSVEVIEDGAISSTAIRVISIPENVRFIGVGGVSGNPALHSIEVLSNEIEIDDYAFSNNNSLKVVTFSEGIVTFSKGLFILNHNLVHVNIPNSVKHIEDEVFKGNSNLEILHIPGSIITFGEDVFKDANKLSLFVHLDKDNPNWQPNWHNERPVVYLEK